MARFGIDSILEIDLADTETLEIFRFISKGDRVLNPWIFTGY